MTERRNKQQLSDSAAVLAVNQALTTSSSPLTRVTAIKDSPGVNPACSKSNAVSLAYIELCVQAMTL